MRLVYIEWYDASNPDHYGWRSREELVKDISVLLTKPCISVGFVIKETSKIIIVASQLSWYGMDSDMDAAIGIPKGWIKKIKELRH